MKKTENFFPFYSIDVPWENIPSKSMEDKIKENPHSLVECGLAYQVVSIP